MLRHFWWKPIEFLQSHVENMHVVFSFCILFSIVSPLERNFRCDLFSFCFLSCCFCFVVSMGKYLIRRKEPFSTSQWSWPLHECYHCSCTILYRKLCNWLRLAKYLIMMDLAYTKGWSTKLLKNLTLKKIK